MYRLSAQDIAAHIGGEVIAGSPEVTATAVAVDSREVGTGTLFVALPGERVDGHAYVAPAFAQGATIALIERPELAATFADLTDAALIAVPNTYRALRDLAIYQRDLFDTRKMTTGAVTVIGVTGSTGKTSTKEFIAAILSARLPVVATRGNQNNELGAPLTILRADERTRALVVEMGMRGKGQIRDLARIARPQIGVVSTLGSSHIELLGSREEIAHAKAELFEALPADGLALYRYEERFAEILRAAAACPTCSVGFDEHADVVLDRVELASTGTPSARITGSFGSFSFGLQVPGEHHLVNASFGIVIGARLGIDNATLAEACATAVLSGMRFKRIEDPVREVTFINDAYNANPTSMSGSLRTFGRMHVPGRRIAVLGDMLELGDYAPKAHAQMGTLAARSGLDLLYCYGEQAATMAAAARAAGLSAVFEFKLDRMDELCASLETALRPHDTVLLKASRGLELEHIIETLGAGSC